MTTKKITQTIDAFFTQLKDVNDEDKVKLFAAVADLLRYSAALTGKNPVPIANFIAAARDFPWDQLDFFVSETLLHEDGAGVKAAQAAGLPPSEIPTVLLKALPAFLELIENGVVESDPTLPQTDLLGYAIHCAAERMAAARPAPPPPPAPEIFVHKHMARVYEASPVTPELFDRLGVAYGLYTKHGQNQIRAFRFDSSPNTYTFLLESGEVVLDERTSAAAELFDQYNRQEDFDRIPLTLLACTQLALADDAFYRHLLPEPLVAECAGPGVSWFAGPFGGFKHPVRSVVLQPDEVQELLVGAIDAGNKDATMPLERRMRVSVSRPEKMPFTEHLGVTLLARYSAAGSVGITSALTKSLETGDVVLMRHDYPRQHVAGFYVFPLETGLVDLTVRL